MQVSLNGKRALVTGGARGIGLAVSLALARAGASVVVGYHREDEAVDRLSHRLKEIGGEHHLVRVDVSDQDSVTALMQTCAERLGGLDVLVNNAGVISHIPFAELEPDEWRRVIDTNLTGVYSVTHAAFPLLSAGSSVVFIGSKAAAVGVPLRAHYTASKAALTGLARSLCKEWGPKGIRVNVVAPGIIATKELPPEVAARYTTLVSLGRLGEADEIANVVTFLGSDLASYITGETINVDGGT